MTDLENRLAEFLKAGVGDPPGRVTVQAVRRQRARRLLAAAAGAVTALGVAAAVSAGLVAGLGRTGPAARSELPAGVPRYYVEVGQNLKTVIRATATGRVTAAVTCPWPRAAPAIYPIAADSHGRFFMACTAFKNHRNFGQPAGARIYQFRVTATGQVHDYGLIPGGNLGPVSVDRMAVTPSGSEIAAIVRSYGGPAATPVAKIVVVNTRTGGHATWRNPPAGPHARRFRLLDVSFADGGQELVFLGERICGQRSNLALCRPTDQQVRALGPAADGGQLDAGRVLLKRTGSGPLLADARISADGSTLTTVSTPAPANAQPWTLTVSQISAGTGRQRVIYQLHGTGGPLDLYFFSSDADGLHFLIKAGTLAHPVAGWIHKDGLVTLKPAGVKVFYEAW